MRIAYHLPGVAPRAAKESDFFATIKRQIPDREDRRWVAYEHPEQGTLLVLGGDALVRPILDSFADPIARDDGTYFLPDRDPLDLLDAIKDEISRPRSGSWVTLESGAEIWVAVAEISEVNFALLASGARRAIPVRHAYGILARDLEAEYQRKDSEIDCQKVMALETRLVVAAIHASYEVTDDQIAHAEVFHLTSSDVDHIVYIALGYDPKGYAAALRASLSSSQAAESPTSLSQPQSIAPSAGGPSNPAPLPG